MGKKKYKNMFEKDKKKDFRKMFKKLFKRETIIKVVVVFSTLALIVASVLPYVLL